MIKNVQFSTIISGDGGNTIQIVIALLASSVGFVVAVVNSVAAYFRDKRHMQELAAQERRFEAFKKELEDKQRRLVRFENVQELMKQYKKPLLQSAFDLQARLANQIKSNFLYQFARKGNDRDREYARLNMAYVVSEFLGWLEVIRQEIVFIVGAGNQTSNLNLIIDAIKFQFTGETPVQGNGRPGDVGAEPQWQVLQLYAGELRAIGEVMITERLCDDNHLGSNLSVIGYAEFVRRLTTEPPTAVEELPAWRASKEKLHQDILSPLLSYIDRLMALDSDLSPKYRMTILQVLLCKLIDVLDDAVPYDIGPEYNLEGGEEPRYISRDFRLTPLWLTDQRFMERVAEVDTSSWEDWFNRLCDLPSEDKELYVRVAFPGFREDTHRDRNGKPLPQYDREQKLGKDSFPGAFPPRQPRQREPWWWAALSPEDHTRWYSEALMKGSKLPPPNHHLHRTGSHRREQKQKAAANWSMALLRSRGGKNTAAAASGAVKPEPQQLRSSGANNSPSDSRVMTPLQVQATSARSGLGA
ncbi:hypothetical protein VOLCADRAFT_85983 [Volvox carteri f. nagariensis]|uniref:Uncharacterized protein n=1 Tax=Volvox carteri f. nagariensis TaxID=3068 RepID=D8THI2_VOLCA|nr:uncharacterized protein VOLCADRAFT_85983 [Volvox carteri f. nagariensis]EFJ53075.1 hypothetical protein VOLCADRAFT_85983 [Volvox carteri f. nagariensis]|eukprot:XP_002946080.1 hypothetical protein VOLCADRAFT_85983 [Volvox carteri f. nagariensis]